MTNPFMTEPQIMRVQMDEEAMRRLLQPILDEVNALTARVNSLEASLDYWRETQMDDGK